MRSEDKNRIAIRLDAEIWRRIRLKSIGEGVSLQKLGEKFFTAWLNGEIDENLMLRGKNTGIPVLRDDSKNEYTQSAKSRILGTSKKEPQLNKWQELLEFVMREGPGWVKVAVRENLKSYARTTWLYLGVNRLATRLSETDPEACAIIRDLRERFGELDTTIGGAIETGRAIDRTTNEIKHRLEIAGGIPDLTEPSDEDDQDEDLEGGV